MVSASVGSMPPNKSLSQYDNTTTTLQTSLSSMLKTSRDELKILGDQRVNLRNQIKGLWDRVSDVESNYWVNGQKTIQRYVTSRGDAQHQFDQWRGDYSKERLLDVKKTMHEQRALRKQMSDYEKELDRLDAQYWEKMQMAVIKISTAPVTPSSSQQVLPVPDLVRRRPHRQTRTKRTRSPARSVLPAAPTRPGPRYHRAISSSASPAADTVEKHVLKKKKKLQQQQAVRPVTRPDPSTFQGVVNAMPGQFYQAYYSHGTDEGWYMGFTLPWDGDEWEEEIALKFSMREIDLKTDWPECYIPNLSQITKEDADGNSVTEEVVTSIKGWTPGFEDGGPRVKERVFLFLYFDDTTRATAKLKIPKKAGPKIKFTKAEIASGNLPIDWVSAANLRPVEVDVGSAIKGRQTAKKFEKMLLELDTLRQDGSGREESSQMIPDEMGSFRASPSASFSSIDDTSIATIPSPGDASHPNEAIPFNNTNTRSLGVTKNHKIQEKHNTKVNFRTHLPSPDCMDMEEHARSGGAMISINSNGGTKRASSMGTNDLTKFDEGVIMDYDLEFEKSVSLQSVEPPRGAFEDGPSQGHTVQLYNARRPIIRGSSIPPEHFLSSSLAGQIPRAWSVPSTD